LRLQDFADATFTKYGVAGLSNRTIWMLVCHVGTSIQALADRLAHHGVVNTTIYVPSDFMYISNTGIPHIMLHVVNVNQASDIVASNDSDYVTIPNSQSTGIGWAGRTISAAGVVAAIAPDDVVAAVVARFDPMESEVED